MSAFDPVKFYREYPAGGTDWLRRCLTAMCQEYARTNVPEAALSGWRPMSQPPTESGWYHVWIEKPSDKPYECVQMRYFYSLGGRCWRTEHDPYPLLGWRPIPDKPLPQNGGSR